MALEQRSSSCRTIFGNSPQDGRNVRKAGTAKPVVERQQRDRPRAEQLPLVS